MKRKIGEIYNKPIVEGDINLKTPNEIHKSELGGGRTQDGSKFKPRYFSIDFNITDEGWKYLLSVDVDNFIRDSNLAFTIGSTYKLIDVKDNLVYIGAYPFMSLDGDRKFYFSYTPLYLDERSSGALNINKYGFLEFEDIIEIMPSLIETIFGKNITLSMNGITEITEEEFYTI